MTVCFDARDPRRLARFWGELLDRPVLDEPAGPVLPGSDTQVALRFLASHASRFRPNQVHLHLTSDDGRPQADTVDAALRLGATHLDVGQRPEEGHVVLADPEGNELCVIEPHNAYLEGTGLLGEVACDGPRAVGVFWSKALGWPLVWDQDDETAIQSPAGGTKVAWGGAPDVIRPDGVRRQPFELTVAGDELVSVVDRLVGLGAAHPAAGGDVVTLLDPGGIPFRVVPG
jgi:hypothetical protein